MRFSAFVLSAVLLFCTSFNAHARLEFDSWANKIQIYGPYIKYNVLKPPYSLGRFQFELNDIRLEVETNDKSEVQVVAVWPRFLLGFGRLKLISKNERILVSESFTGEDTLGDDKYVKYPIDDGDASLLDDLNEAFQICIEQEYEESFVKACSDFFFYKDDKFQNTFTDENSSSVKFNGKKSPKNVQIQIPEKQEKISLKLKFKSGFSLEVGDIIRRVNKKNIVIDPKEKRIGIFDGSGVIRPTELTLKDRFFSFIKETNHFRNQYGDSKNWPENLEDAEMEFAPYQFGASIQLYGLILDKVPPPFSFKLNDKTPLATYSRNVELKGTKLKDEVLAAKEKNELFIHDNQTEFLWVFPTPKKGEMNQNYLSLQYKGQDYYFSNRVFRAHRTSLSGSVAISASQTLEVVPGYNFRAEHWFEQIWGKSSYSYQRWGLGANIYETAQAFKIDKSSGEKVSVNPTHFDVMFRLTPGVRPVQSSFGLGVRYLNFKFFRSISSDVEAQLLGLGVFWHTAPQKIIEDIFNIIPFFRYPKWMEVGLYYFPVSFSDISLGFSFSWQLKGKMFFAKNWFAEASFNVNSVSFEKRNSIGRVDRFGIATGHGTVGIGYMF